MSGIFDVLSSKVLKKHPAIIPTVATIGLGFVMGVGFLTRMAISNPEVTWDQKKNNEPWQRYANKRYQLIKGLEHEPFDAKNYKHPRPPF